MKYATIVFSLVLAGCGGNDQSAAGAAPVNAGKTLCEAWPHDGLEPACDFDPGPDPGRTEPPASALPKPTGTCPGFVDGDGCRAGTGALVCLFQPEGEPAREVTVWMSPDGNHTGPLVFYYFGLLGFPSNAVTPLAGFPADAMQRLFDAGGVLVAPTARPDRNPVKFSRLPWIDALGFEDDMGDFVFADEIVGCAIEKLGIDARRIHVSGLSAGGWMTSQVAVHRSAYIASASLFSGGLESLEELQDPTNKFPVAMFHGGPSDVVGAHFENEAQTAVNVWRHEGHFAMNCGHGGGHSVPVAAGLAGMQFLLDHPYGTTRSPYCDAAPPEMSLCALTTPATGGVAPADGAPEAEVTACTGRVGDAGLTDTIFTEELVSCSCSRCGAALSACLDDPGCTDVMRCASDNGCFGISCYQDHLCAPSSTPTAVRRGRVHSWRSPTVIAWAQPLAIPVPFRRADLSARSGMPLV